MYARRLLSSTAVACVTVAGIIPGLLVTGWVHTAQTADRSPPAAWLLILAGIAATVGYGGALTALGAALTVLRDTGWQRTFTATAAGLPLFTVGGMLTGLWWFGDRSTAVRFTAAILVLLIIGIRMLVLAGHDITMRTIAANTATPATLRNPDGDQ